MPARKLVPMALVLVAGGCTDGTAGNAAGDDCTNVASWVIDGGIACDRLPTDPSVYEVTVAGAKRLITFNYVPPHTVRGNVTARERTFSVPALPEPAAGLTPVANESFDGTGSIGWIFGIAASGVPFDPVANEGWRNPDTGDLNFEWNLEVLSTNTDLIYDCNNAHDPSRYHYHGTPAPWIESLGDEDGSRHSHLLGWAADGFPIYYKYGHSDPLDASSPIVELRSSWALKDGCRPGDGVGAPDGPYDGTYVNDYRYVAGRGDLDECNGRFAKTPEFPDGTYVYHLTDEFPSVPRFFRGAPSEDFRIGIGP